MAAGDEARRKQCLAARDMRGAARPHEATVKTVCLYVLRSREGGEEESEEEGGKR